MGEVWSKEKNPISILSACSQPLVTTQKVLSGSITPLLGLAQRWFFKEKMPFGIFELWQHKNRPLKNTHPKSITIFKSPVEERDLRTPQSYNLARQLLMRHSQQRWSGLWLCRSPRQTLAPCFLNKTLILNPPLSIRRKTCQMHTGESHMIQKRDYLGETHFSFPRWRLSL